MNIFTSGWLRRMAMKSATSPEARILNVFTILQDWLTAPGVREQIAGDSIGPDVHEYINKLFLDLASDGDFVESGALALQLSFILLGAVTDSIRKPDGTSLAQASEAAKCLLAAAKPQPRTYSRRVAMVFLVLATVSAGVMWGGITLPAKQPTVLAKALVSPSTAAVKTALNPDRLSELYTLHNKVQAGQCSYPQALMLAASQRAVFMDGVVNIGSVDVIAANQDEVNTLYKLYSMVDCYYAPAAMQL